MTDSQDTGFVAFDIKGSCVCHFAVGSIEHRMHFVLVHNVARWKQRFERNLYMHLKAADINVKRT